VATTADAIHHIDQVRTMLSTDVGRLATAGAKAAKSEATAVASSMGPLSHMGRRGVALRAGYDVDGSVIELKLRPPGAWIIAERKSAAHRITPKRRRVRLEGRGRGGAALGGGLSHPAASAHHPGGRGRGAIAKAFGRARRVIPTAIHDEQVRRMRSIYG